MGTDEGNLITSEEDVVRSTVVRIGLAELDRELHRQLPDGFRENYLALCLKALARPVTGYRSDGVVSSTPTRVRTSTGQTETRGGAKPGKKLAGASTKNPAGNDGAMAYKARVDRKLRKLAREMRVWLNDDRAAKQSVRRCTRCGRFGDEDWSFCPYDGAMVQEVD